MHSFLGIEIWQVKAGTIFGDFLVTDSVEEAEAAAEKVLKRVEGEKKMKEEEEKKKSAEEATKKAAEDAAKKTEEKPVEPEEKKEDL